MPWGEIGAVLAVLVIVFVVGHAWFHIVEGALGLLKRLFFRKKEPPAWHPLPPEQEEGGSREE